MKSNKNTEETANFNAISGQKASLLTSVLLLLSMVGGVLQYAIQRDFTGITLITVFAALYFGWTAVSYAKIAKAAIGAFEERRKGKPSLSKIDFKTTPIARATPEGVIFERTFHYLKDKKVKHSIIVHEYVEHRILKVLNKYAKSFVHTKLAHYIAMAAMQPPFSWFVKVPEDIIEQSQRLPFSVSRTLSNYDDLIKPFREHCSGEIPLITELLDERVASNKGEDKKTNYLDAAGGIGCAATEAVGIYGHQWLRSFVVDLYNWGAKDLPPEKITQIQKLGREKGIDLLSKQFTFIQDDVTSFRLDEKMDVITCIQALQWMDHPLKGIINLYNHLNRGGQLLTTYSVSSEHEEALTSLKRALNALQIFGITVKCHEFFDRAEDERYLLIHITRNSDQQDVKVSIMPREVREITVFEAGKKLCSKVVYYPIQQDTSAGDIFSIQPFSASLGPRPEGTPLSTKDAETEGSSGDTILNSGMDDAPFSEKEKRILGYVPKVHVYKMLQRHGIKLSVTLIRAIRKLCPSVRSVYMDPRVRVEIDLPGHLEGVNINTVRASLEATFREERKRVLEAEERAESELDPRYLREIAGLVIKEFDALFVRGEKLSFSPTPSDGVDYYLNKISDSPELQYIAEIMLSFGSAEEAERAFSRGVVGPVQYQGRDEKRYIEELKEKDKPAGELLEFLFSLNLPDSELKGDGNLVDHAELGKLFGYSKEDILAHARYNILPEYWDKAKFYQAAEIFNEKRPLIRIISEYAVRIGVDIGPALDTPSLIETTQIYDTITAHLRKENIEVLLPQQEFKLTGVMKNTLDGVDSRMPSFAGINAKPYDEANLKSALKPSGKDKIILVTKTTRPFVSALLESNPQAFKNVRILQVDLPNFDRIKDENEKTVHQARIIMIAALSRLLKETENGTESNVEIVLKRMLTGLIVSLDPLSEDKITLKSFIEALKRTDAEGASNKDIQDRLDLFLNKAAVRLTEDLARDLKFIKLFWQSA